MFKILRLRFFIAKVQAELFEQLSDQSLINRICQLPGNLENLAVIKECAYYRKDGCAAFLAACHVLSKSMYSAELSQEERAVCAVLLFQRLEKVNLDMQFRMRHLMLIGELESATRQWAAENEAA